MSAARHFSAFRIILFLSIVAGIFVWDGHEKIPTGPAEGNALVGAPAATQPARHVLRVATFNINGGVGGADNRLDLSRTIASFQAGFDLIGMQEVHGEDQAAAIADALHMPHLFAPVEHQWWSDDFGNAAVTDLAVEHWQRIPLSSNGAYSNRNLILMRLRFGDHDLNVIITHIDRKEDRITELNTVFNLFKSVKSPALMMGDFNSPPNNSTGTTDPTLVALIAADPEIADPIGTGYDRIFAHGLTAIASGHTDNGASDHPMAWAQFTLSLSALTSSPSTSPPATSPAQ